MYFAGLLCLYYLDGGCGDCVRSDMCVDSWWKCSAKVISKKELEDLKIDTMTNKLNCSLRRNRRRPILRVQDDRKCVTMHGYELYEFLTPAKQMKDTELTELKTCKAHNDSRSIFFQYSNM